MYVNILYYISLGKEGIPLQTVLIRYCSVGPITTTMSVLSFMVVVVFLGNTTGRREDGLGEGRTGVEEELGPLVVVQEIKIQK